MDWTSTSQRNSKMSLVMELGLIGEQSDRQINFMPTVQSQILYSHQAHPKVHNETIAGCQCLEI